MRTLNLFLWKLNDIEKILDEVVFISYGEIKLQQTADEIREAEGKSIDELFREVFKC